MPPVAAAALADAIAATGNSPALMIADLKAELSDAVERGEIENPAAEQEAIRKLEKEVCGGAVPLGKCAKCRVAPRDAHMIGCMHLTLCKQCESTVSAHVRGNSERAFKLARLMCPICRGFEVETSASADSVFELIDLNKSGTIESGELLLHLLVAGQEPETISELFAEMDTNQDGVISIDEWRAGFTQFMQLAHRDHGGSIADGTEGPGGGAALKQDDAEDDDSAQSSAQAGIDSPT